MWFDAYQSDTVRLQYCRRMFANCLRRLPRPLRKILSALALAGTLVLGNAAISEEETAYLFNKECASCHGKDGKARTPVGRKLGAKDLRESKTSDAEIEKQILEGKKAKDGGYTMPAFKEKLDPDEIKALISFVKKFRK